MSWINYNALWKIILYGVVLGAGLPALFAVGLVSLSRGNKVQTAGGETESDSLIGGNPLGMLLAAICFLIVLVAIGWGIYEVYKIGHPAATPAPAPSPSSH
ncbi:MAG TPA: hypothetical protein VGG16_16420 [Streptosporangiaceae bacterium]|jgi:hypothetical protein